jgi:hypothetical protein
MDKSNLTGPASIRKNWVALRAIATSFFRNIRKEHPEWTTKVLLENLDLPHTALMLDLAATAGFCCGAEPTTDEICAILAQQMNGIHSAEAISCQTGIALQKVQRVLETRAGGYGKAPYGYAPYGSNRAVSNGKASVSRRITVKGQLSYRGNRYSLGALYRGRTVFVRERESDLLVTWSDRSPLHLTRYQSR